MRQRQFSQLAGTFFALLLLCSAAGLSLAADRGRGAGEILRISGWKLPFNVPIMVEREQGAYERAFSGFTVTTVDLSTGPRLLSAMAAGELDIVQGVGDAAFLVARAAGIDARIIAVNSRSPKAFAVVAIDPAIRTMADLRGKRVVGLRGSVVHEVFVRALAEVGMSESDVEFFPMPVAQAASTLLAGRADAALLVGSEIQQAVNADGHVLADGEGRVRGLSLVVAREGFLREHPGAVEQFREMRRQTLRFMEEDPAAALAIAARETKRDAVDVRAMWKLYDFNYEITSEDRASLADTQRYLRENGMMTRSVDINQLFP